MQDSIHDSSLFHWNAFRRDTDTWSAPSHAARALHRRLPGYQPSPLHTLPELAAELGVDQILVKDESARLGLPAFKILGAAWAAYRSLELALEDAGEQIEPWADLAQLAARFVPLKPFTLVTATDGNHGRALARTARLFGANARVFVPHATAPARVAAIESEGAEVVRVDGSYERAVERARDEAGPRAFVVQDTSWTGYEQVPGWVVEGYATLFWELEEQLAAQGEPAPTLAFVPIGVGALAMAAVRHFRRADAAPTTVVGVEPQSAACALAALRADEPVEILCPHTSIMAGLNSGRLAPFAWPTLRAGLDATMAIGDESCEAGLQRLARAGITAGECGGAGLGALLACLRAPALASALAIDGSTRVLLLVTEGVTDPARLPRSAPS